MQSEISNVLLILKSLGANYPVLKSAGYEITKVPVLVVESGQATKCYQNIDKLSYGIFTG